MAECASEAPVVDASADSDQAAAAVKIQSIQRGKNERADVQDKKDQTAAAVKIQAINRGKTDRAAVEDKKDQTAAAVKIQAINRGKNDRVAVQDKKDQKDATLKIQSIARGRKDREAAKKEKDLAKIDQKLANQAKAQSSQLSDKLQEIEDSILRVETYHSSQDGSAVFLGQTGVSKEIFSDLPGCALRMDMGLRGKPGGAEQPHVQGQLVFKVHRQHAMKVTLVGADNLKKADTFGQSDPYCIFYWTGAKNGKEKKLRTSTVKNKTLTPSWEGEDETVSVNLPVNVAHGTLRVEVWDKDKMSDDEFLGHAVLQGKEFDDYVKGKEMTSGKDIEISLPLGTKLFTKKSKNKYVGGNIKLRLQSHKLLKISVVEATGLAMPEGETAGCNPYCDIFWNQQPLGTTGKQKKTTNPVWTDETYSLKWTTDVMDAAPVAADGSVKISKNAAMMKEMQNSLGSTGSDERRDSVALLSPAIYALMGRFGEYIEKENVKLSELFQAMDCEQNGYLGKDELMKHLNSEAKFHISEEEAGLLMDHLDEDGNGIIDLNELEVLVRMSLRVMAHKKTAPAAESSAPQILSGSASAPVVCSTQASPRMKLADAKELDGQLNPAS